jgi:glycosyltransferase involved in cell wall biosynthesis
MIDSIVLAGPVYPPKLAKWLNPEDRARATATSALGGTSLTNLAEAFLSAGRSVEIVTLAPELENEPLVLEGPRLRILIGPYRSRARGQCVDGFRRERQYVRKLVSDTSGVVVNAHWTYEFALGAIVPRNRAVVITIHDAPLTILRNRPDIYRMVRTALAIAVRCRRSTLTAVSTHAASAWRRQMLDRHPIWVVPNAVPIPDLAACTVKDTTRPTILEIAANGRLKNVASLIRAMPAVLATNAQARLVLVGPGLIPASDLGQLAKGLGVSASIEFLGPLAPQKLDPLFRKATVFVHASREEAFGMSVCEAMTYGLPVVGGSNAGAIPWLLGQGSAGMLVDTAQPVMIADAICSLLRDEGLRQRLGEAARQRAISRFSATAVADGYAEVYEKAAAAVT